MGESSDMSEELRKSSSAMALTGKIMVIAVIILFIVVIFVLLLPLYAKWFWRRLEEPSPSPPNTRRRRRRFVFAPGQDTTVALRKGLDPAVLRSIPIVVFSPEEFKDGLECAVCLSELAQGEKARLLPKCNHGFHVDCIDMWLESHCTCPLCRNPVDGGMCSESVDVIDLEEEIEDGVISRATGGSGSIGDGSTNVQPMEEGLSGGGGVNSTESLNFPTNVLFWGNETQVSSRSAGVAVSGNGNDNVCLEECGSPSSSSMAIGGNRPDGMVVIDMPRQMADSVGSSSRSSEEEMKAPVTTRLRSLKRLLSRERRVNPSCGVDSVDIELAGRVQPC